MKEGDGDTWCCYYCVMKLRWKPQDYLSLSNREKALLLAFIQEKAEQDKIQSNKLKAENTRVSRR